MFKRPGNLNGVTGFMKQTELYPFKCRSKGPFLSTYSFNRVCNLNVKLFTIVFRSVVFVLTLRRAPVNRISCFVFGDQCLTKTLLVPIIADSCTRFFFNFFFYACGEYMWS